MSIQDDNDTPTWARHRPQPQPCPIGAEGCEGTFTVSRHRTHAKTCPNPECKAEYDRRYARGYYKDNADRIIADQIAAKRRRREPVLKECQAPHPTKLGALCGNKFEVKTVGDGRRLTCSKACSRRRRWAVQRDRYHADPQAKRDYKNEFYAENYAQLGGKTRCPNPACGREYTKKRSNQDTCGRAVCHLWKYGITHREEINERKRKKRRGNPNYAALSAGLPDGKSGQVRNLSAKKD